MTFIWNSAIEIEPSQEAFATFVFSHDDLHIWNSAKKVEASEDAFAIIEISHG